MAVVIDLGEVGRTPPAGPPPGRPRPGRRPARTLAAALLLAAVLATVAAAAPLPAVAEPVHLEASNAVQLVLDGDLLVVVDQQGRRNRGGGHTIAAYELPGGDLRWRVPAPDHGGGRLRPEPVNVLIAGDLLLVGYLGTAGVRTVALDTGDGSVRWTADGVPQGVALDGAPVLRGTVTEAGSGADEALLGGSAVQVLEPASGRVRWRTAVSGFVDVVFRVEDGRLADVAEIESGRQVRVRDVRTGQVRSSAAAPELLLLPGQVWVVADLLVAATDDTLTAFELETLAPRWSVAVPPVSSITACGSLLCVSHASGGAHGRDPVDGAARWVNDDWYSNQVFGRYLLVAPGRLDGLPSARRLVADPAIGALLSPGSEQWHPLVPDGDGWLGLWFDQDRTQVWVARIGPGTSPPQMLRHIRDSIHQCWSSTVALVCRRADGGLGVWALPD